MVTIPDKIGSEYLVDVCKKCNKILAQVLQIQENENE